ncbi:acyl carrier protein [Sandarakinorhabdus sp.]|uniref:acyl carrier protein n=1 Tax=Sandarakinorhabdus sp. TaxID=1916663 RepID=UPI003563E694
MTLIDQIRDVFLTELGIPPEDFSPGLAYGAVPEWDSASHMVIVTALEERFGIMFESEELVELSTVARIEQALREKGISDGHGA